MISVKEAVQIISQNIQLCSEEEVYFQHANNRVLRQEIKADRAYPPYDRVTMDGIAIDYNAYASGIREFPVQGIQTAGSPQQTLFDEAHCIEVMTGAVCPQKADTVIRYEDVEFRESGGMKIARITIEGINSKQNVHHRGTDRISGSVLIKPGKLISPAEIGVIASSGYVKVKVSRLPKVAIISSGDELVEVDAVPAPHQIRKSNIYTLQAAISEFGIKAHHFHMPDEKELITEELNSIIQEYDLMILSGGVSKGKKDYIPEVLDDLGVEKLFHRVKQRPGKPFWFGRNKDQKLIFALPGNPVSTFVSYYKYIKPWLASSLGVADQSTLFAKLSADFHFRPPLTYFLQVNARCNDQGVWLAEPVEGHGSGDHANLLDVNGFMELPDDRDHFKAGEVYPLMLFRRA
jgi:molybdopterin molybdotransferase